MGALELSCEVSHTKKSLNMWTMGALRETGPSGNRVEPIPLGRAEHGIRRENHRHFTPKAHIRRCVVAHQSGRSLLREGSHIGLFEAGFKRTRVGQHPQISTQIAAAGAAKPLLLCESCDVSRNLFFYVRRRFWTRRSAGWATEVGVEQRPAIGDGILFGSGCHLGFGDKDVVRKANAR